MYGARNVKFFLAPFPGALGRGQKVKYHLISITKSISKIFIPNFVCVLTNERYKTYQTVFLFCCLGHAPWSGLRGTGGAQGVNKFFFKHGHVAYQIDGDDEQNKMQVKFSSQGQTGDLGARSKGQISLTCQFQRFLYQTLCVFSQIKDRKHIEQNFYSVAKFKARWWDCRVLGESKTFAWGFAMAPHRLRTLVCLYEHQQET